MDGSTISDLCTRWPRTIPLRSTTSEAEALLLIFFFKVWVPKYDVIRNGPQFKSQATRIVLENVGVHHVFFSSPYHSQINGTVEKFNDIHKSLSKVIVEHQTN